MFGKITKILLGDICIIYSYNWNFIVLTIKNVTISRPVLQDVSACRINLNGFCLNFEMKYRDFSPKQNLDIRKNRYEGKLLKK